MKSIKEWQRPELGKLEKLPKWAQSYISLLEMWLVEEEKKVEGVLGEGVEYGDTNDSGAYVRFGTDNLYRKVPMNTRLRVPAGDGCVVEAQVGRHDNEGLEVMVSGGSASIIPQVSNVIHVRGVRR